MSDYQTEELRAQLAQVTEAALETAERLALRVLDRPGFDPHALMLAHTVAEQTRLAHRLRRSLVLEVAG